jgi:dUTP pyrophosphatase
MTEFAKGVGRDFAIAKGFEDAEINLPKRETKNAAGYDFEAAEDTLIPSMWKVMVGNIGKFFKGEEDYIALKPTLVKTGVKAYMEEDEMLCLYNRSGNPLKKGLILANGVGVVDSDYYNNEKNDGHIMFQFWNWFPFNVDIKKGDRIGQGVFQKFLKTNSDSATKTRNGGFGSTGN